MTIAEEGSGSQRPDSAAANGRRSARTNIFVAVILALAVYIFGYAVFERSIGAAAPRDRHAAETRLGPWVLR